MRPSYNFAHDPDARHRSWASSDDQPAYNQFDRIKARNHSQQAVSDELERRDSSMRVLGNMELMGRLDYGVSGAALSPRSRG